MSQKSKLLVSLELSNKNWQLCFSEGSEFKQKTIEARYNAPQKLDSMLR